MASRSFFVTDSENLVVTSSPNGVIVGNPIINNSDTPDGTVFSFSSSAGTTVTLDDTGGSEDLFEDDDAGNHIITDGAGLVANGTQVEAESQILVRALDAGGNPTGPEITIFVFSQNGDTSDIWGFATDTALVDGTSYVKTGGSNLGAATYQDIVPCFAQGTEIETPNGLMLVEDISVGDLIWTRDAGALPVRWVASTQVAGVGALAPVVFAPGAIGNTHELVVSQQHRMRIENTMAELLFGVSEVLIPAVHLCGLPGVTIEEREEVTYTHFMFDTHQIVRSNGALTESFFLSDISVGALDAAPARELRALFPQHSGGFDRFGPTAARSLTGREAETLRPFLM